MPRTRDAIFRSTSMPLCDSTSTTCAPGLPLRPARASSTHFCMPSSRMPKLHSATMWRGLAIGVYGNAWPMIATGTPWISRIDVRREDLVLEVGRDDVLREELDAALEIALDDLLHALGAVGHFPVRGHEVDAEQLGGVDHVLGVGPQRGRRTLPGVAAIEQQRAGTRGLEPLDQRRQVREAADLAVGARRLREVEVGEGVRLGRAGTDAEALEQRLADEVRRLAQGVADAEVDARLAEAHRLQLRVAIGEVQHADVAEARHVVEALPGIGLARARRRRRAACRRRPPRPALRGSRGGSCGVRAHARGLA